MAPFFRTPLRDEAAVWYRHQVLAERMRAVRDDLAESIYHRRDGRSLFLRAQREHDGSRTYRLSEAAPLPTSYGEDLYRETFTGPREEVPA